MNICNFNRCFENIEEPELGCNCCHKHFCEKDLKYCSPACCHPCWDTCKCMDEILKLKSGLDSIDTDINNIEGRITRYENTIRDNFSNLSQIIGSLAEKEENDIQTEKERAVGEEQRIEDRLDYYIQSNDDALEEERNARITGDNTEKSRAIDAENNILTILNNYITSNDNALAAEISRATIAENAIDDSLQVEIARAKAAEQVLDSVKANKVDVYTKQETYTKQEVEGRISDLINNAPAALDTLGEIADKLHDNDDVVSSIINSISQERQAREAADVNINNTLNTLTVNHNADISALNSAIQAEITRATNSEDVIRTKVNNTSNKNAIIGFGENKTVATVNGIDVTVGVSALPQSIDNSIINIGISGNTLVITKANGQTSTIELPSGYIQVLNQLSNAIDDANNRIDGLPTTYVNPYTLSWSGYNTGNYDGSSTKSFVIPDNTNQLINGAGYITSSGSITGNAATATKATQDGSGNVITNTYLTKANGITGISVSGAVMTITKGDGTTSTVNLGDLVGLAQRVAALESLWTDNGTTLTAKSGRSVTGAGFYDSTIS